MLFVFCSANWQQANTRKWCDVCNFKPCSTS